MQGDLNMTMAIKNITFPIAAALFLAAFIIPPTIIAEEFKYEKEGLSFILEYGDTSTLEPLKSKAEVFRATAPGGLPVVTVSVFKLDALSPALEDNAGRLVDIFNAIGSDTELLESKMVQTVDGTPGLAYEVKWMFGGNTRLTTNGIFAYKNGYRIFVSVTHMGNPLEINHIVNSLKFI